MPGFDIRTLVNFHPADLRCKRCLGMLVYNQLRAQPFICPICEVEYIPSDVYIPRTYLVQEGYRTQFKDLVAHARRLAIITDPNRWDPLPPLRMLNEALLAAAYWVHIISWGIDLQMLGALRLLGGKVNVYGVFSNVSHNLRTELVDFPDEAPRLHARCVPSSSGWSAPHQKIVIIDGLLAFTGSANFTVNGWRKSGEGRDIVETITDVDKVRELNNRYFSPQWAELSSDQGPIIMMQDIPF